MVAATPEAQVEAGAADLFHVLSNTSRPPQLQKLKSKQVRRICFMCCPTPHDRRNSRSSSRSRCGGFVSCVVQHLTTAATPEAQVEAGAADLFHVLSNTSRPPQLQKLKSKQVRRICFMCCPTPHDRRNSRSSSRSRCGGFVSCVVQHLTTAATPEAQVEAGAADLFHVLSNTSRPPQLQKLKSKQVRRICFMCCPTPHDRRNSRSSSRSRCSGFVSCVVQHLTTAAGNITHSEDYCALICIKQYIYFVRQIV